jgi:hypothetical protein
MRFRGTIDHLLRHPSFEGMRQDELPSAQFETPCDSTAFGRSANLDG